MYIVVFLYIIFFNIFVQSSEINVMIVDTGVDSTNKKINSYIHKTFDSYDLTDDYGHGTHISGLILYGPKLNDPVCKQVHLYSCRYYGLITRTTTDCFNQIKKFNIQIVNFSGGGYSYIKEEAVIIKNNSNTLFITAIGNDNLDLKQNKYYPASLLFSNIRVVGNGISFRRKNHSSNYGLNNIYWRQGNNIISFFPNGKNKIMSGSSQSTAIYTHEQIQKLCKIQ